MGYPLYGYKQNALEDVLGGDDSSYRHVNKGLERFHKKLTKSGFTYYSVEAGSENNLYVVFGGHKNSPGNYYAIALRGLHADGKNVDADKIEIMNEKSEGGVLKNGKDTAESVGFTGTIKYKKLGRLLGDVYNNNVAESNPDLPFINNGVDRKVLYAAAAIYGGIGVGVFNHLTNNFIPGYESLLLGLDVAPFLALYAGGKVKSLATVAALGAVAWIANSIAWYPVGMALGHGSLSGMVNWYKSQIGLGSGSYVDNFGPFKVTVDSATKAMSYLTRGLAAVGLGAIGQRLSNIKLKKHVKV